MPILSDFSRRIDRGQRSRTTCARPCAGPDGFKIGRFQ